MKLSVVIPVYNEINTILEILRRVKDVPIEKEIIVVDDGSTDGTREALKEIKEKNIKIFFNKRNRGKGYSIRRGFKYASGEIVIIQDADLEYYPDEYPILIQRILEGKAEVVYGTRFQGARRVFNFYHYLGNKLLNLIANILYNTNLSDLMTCYKAFRIDVLRQLHLGADGFGIEAEITAKLFRQGFRVYEVPISYNGRDYEEGKKISWKDFFPSVYWLLRCKFEYDDVGQDTLLRVRLMKNNNRWVFEQIKPYLGENILEVGSGIGNISRFLVTFGKRVVLSEINDRYLEYLKYRFLGNPKVKIINQDILAKDISRVMPERIDTVVVTNVLEHLEDDYLALGNIRKILVKNGRLILLVPALKALYGSLDKELGHFRRYEKEELKKKLEKSGFAVEKLYFHDFLASLGWYINSRILEKKIMTRFQIIYLDKLIPHLAWIEEKIKIPFGLSLVAVARKK